jgi:hypothetical protein
MIDSGNDHPNNAISKRLSGKKRRSTDSLGVQVDNWRLDEDTNEDAYSRNVFEERI